MVACFGGDLRRTSSNGARCHGIRGPHCWKPRFRCGYISSGFVLRMGRTRSCGGSRALARHLRANPAVGWFTDRMWPDRSRACCRSSFCGGLCGPGVLAAANGLALWRRGCPSRRYLSQTSTAASDQSVMLSPLPNKPLERPGVSQPTDISAASAGRSAWSLG